MCFYFWRFALWKGLRTTELCVYTTSREVGLKSTVLAIYCNMCTVTVVIIPQWLLCQSNLMTLKTILQKLQVRFFYRICTGLCLEEKLNSFWLVALLFHHKPTTLSASASVPSSSKVCIRFLALSFISTPEHILPARQIFIHIGQSKCWFFGYLGRNNKLA